LAEAQVKQDHDLVKDGEPVSGMSVQQQRTDRSETLQSYKKVRTTEIPPLLENTLQDKEFEGWKNGEVFYDNDRKIYEVRMDSIRTYQFNDQGTRLNPSPAPPSPDTTTSVVPAR